MAKVRKMDRSKWKTRKFWCLHDVANLSLASDKKRGALIRQPYVCQYLQTALSQLAKKVSLLMANCVVQMCARQFGSWQYLMDMVVVFKAKGATESIFLFPQMSFSFETRFYSRFKIHVTKSTLYYFCLLLFSERVCYNTQVWESAMSKRALMSHWHLS